MDTVVLVTGANGFLGRHLIQSLVAHTGICVVATDQQENAVPLNPDGPSAAAYFCGNIADPMFVKQLATKVQFDCIIHLAAVLSKSTDSSTYQAIMDANIHSTFLVLEAAASHHARVIFPSTALVYGNQPGPFNENMATAPRNFYALSKLMCEELVGFYSRTCDLSAIVFRIGILYGPSQTGTMFIPSLISSLLDNREFLMTRGEQTRDFVYIDDAIAAFVTAVLRNDIAGTYNLGTGTAPTMRTVAQLAGKIAGISDLIKMGVLPYRPDESMEYCLSFEKAKAELNWTPSISLEEGLAKTIAYERQQRRSHE